MRKRREFLKMKREEAKQEEGAQVAIPAPDPPLPPTFDADANAHRYRFLEAPGGWLARCVVSCCHIECFQVVLSEWLVTQGPLGLAELV